MNLFCDGLNTMTTNRSKALRGGLAFVAGLLIYKVTVAVMLGYVNYLPPNFDSDFLRGREGYFFGAYQWAFYAHIASGPVSLFLGVLLMSDWFRMCYPKWHRWLGRVQAANVLLLVAPTGLWMAWYAQTGPVAGVSFAILSVLTGTTVALGWRAAVQRQFQAHRRWMSRCFVLLCSAVVLRLVVGFATVVGVNSMWFDPVVSWASWLVPLATLEMITLLSRRAIRSRVPQPVKPPDATT